MCWGLIIRSWNDCTNVPCTQNTRLKPDSYLLNHSSLLSKKDFLHTFRPWKIPRKRIQISPSMEELKQLGSANVYNTQPTNFMACSIVITTGLSSSISVVLHKLSPHCKPVETIPGPNDELKNQNHCSIILLCIILISGACLCNKLKPIIIAMRLVDTKKKFRSSYVFGL